VGEFGTGKVELAQRAGTVWMILRVGKVGHVVGTVGHVVGTVWLGEEGQQGKEWLVAHGHGEGTGTDKGPWDKGYVGKA
jgi:hypothetical protein